MSKNDLLLYALWNMCSVIAFQRRFTQYLHGDTSQKTAFFIVTAAENLKSYTTTHLFVQKIVDKKEILRTASNTGIYCSSDSWYSLPSIIHFRKFHRQHQCTLQLV
jgi:hypothetical protein